MRSHVAVCVVGRRGKGREKERKEKESKAKTGKEKRCSVHMALADMYAARASSHLLFVRVRW